MVNTYGVFAWFPHGGWGYLNKKALWATLDHHLDHRERPALYKQGLAPDNKSNVHHLLIRHHQFMVLSFISVVVF